jgi:Tfp pilus assembly pilus retraction ATPase PilT
VILIGEIRDTETMEHAIAFAETGHLCLGTLHANNANQTMDRIINFFPEERRNQLLMDLSSNLRAIVSQRLVRTEDGKGRKAAIEILLNTPTIAEMILKGNSRHQGDHAQVARAGHVHVRPGAVRALQRRATSATTKRSATPTRPTACACRSSCTTRPQWYKRRGSFPRYQNAN